MGQSRTWHVFVDDSYSGGRILDKKFERVPITDDGLRPILNSGAVLINAKHLPAVEARWLRLRRQIAREGELLVPPVIHMRQLWGKRPPDRPDQNPFHPFDAATRFTWARQIVDLISGLCTEGLIEVSAFSQPLLSIQDSTYRFHQQADAREQNRQITAKFGKRSVGFYNVSLNPLPRMIAQTMLIYDHYFQQKNEMMEYYYDLSEGAKAFDLLQSYAFIRSSGQLRNTLRVTPTNTRDTPMLQIADVVSYLNHRKMHAHHMGTPDQGVEDLIRGNSWRGYDPHSDTELMAEGLALSPLVVMLQYELALLELRKHDAGWVREHLLTPEELVAQFQAQMAAGDTQSGVILLRSAYQK